jgi:YidC/Oxa1 family membrane protein insertase
MTFAWTMPLAMLLLQSNDVIARAVQEHIALPPDYTHYTGITGSFGAIFLMLITAIGAMIQNYGLAIILSCICVRLLLLVLTRTQIHGMKTMQMLQPVMKEIQRYYPDRNDQSAKTMELYSQYKINPLSGCLPMLIQLPIMFGVYRALYDASFAGKDFLGIQLLFPVNVTAGRSFGGGPDLADLIDLTVNKLHLQGQILHIPANIPVVGGGFWYWPALILVVLYVLSSFFMQRIMKKVNAPHPEFEAEFKAEMKSADGKPQQPDMAAQMQKQMGMMNIMIVVFAFIFSSGALLYFIAQNLLMALEYTLLPRTMQFAYDAKELKAFVRRPPPPLKTAGTAKPAVKDLAAPRNNGAMAQVETEASVSNQEDGLDGSAEAVASGSLKRPLRKRRKR